MKITLRQLRQIIKEGIDILNTETGELLVFEDDWQDGSADAPEAAARDIMKRLNIAQLGSEIDGDIETIEVAPEDWALMDVELRGKRRYRKNKKEQERLDVDNLLKRLDQWAADASSDYAADNPGIDMQGVARDLAASAKYAFEPDEWEELVWHFDKDFDYGVSDYGSGEDLLIDIIADSIVG
jgi:hypothetical protein